MKRVCIIASLVVTLLSGLLLHAWKTSSAAPMGGQQPAGSCGTWTTVPSPDPGFSTNFLNGVAAVAAGNVWAVGSYSNGNGGFPLIEHLSNSKWTVVSSPNIAGSLSGIAVITTSNIWAVGENDSSNMQETLVEHWNGSAWKVVSSPNFAPTGNMLAAISVVSAKDIWAVGTTTSASSTSGYQPLIEHWNGTQWSVVTGLLLGTSDMVNGMVALSSKNITVVGDYRTSIDPQGPYYTLTEHWNGSQWSAASSPSPGSVASDLSAVARVPKTSHLWAVGFTYDGSTYQTLVEKRC